MFTLRTSMFSGIFAIGLFSFAGCGGSSEFYSDTVLTTFLGNGATCTGVGLGGAGGAAGCDEASVSAEFGDTVEVGPLTYENKEVVVDGDSFFVRASFELLPPSGADYPAGSCYIEMNEEGRDRVSGCLGEPDGVEHTVRLYVKSSLDLARDPGDYSTDGSATETDIVRQVCAVPDGNKQIRIVVANDADSLYEPILCPELGLVIDGFQLTKP